MYILYICIGSTNIIIIFLKNNIINSSVSDVEISDEFIPCMFLIFLNKNISNIYFILTVILVYYIGVYPQHLD